MSFIDEFQSGCTGISWIVRKFGGELPGEVCCARHDIAYDNGGSFSEKWQRDKDLALCIYLSHDNEFVARVASFGAWMFITFLPYSYYVWFRSPKR